MTATPTSGAAPAADDRTSSPFGSALRAATRVLLPMSLGAASAWWIAPILALSAATIVQPAWLGQVDTSLWQVVLYAVPTASLVLAIVLATIHLPLHVVNGISRRTFFRAAGVTHLVNTLVAIVVGTAGFAVERATLVPLGLQPGLFEAHLFTSTDQYARIGMEIVFGMALAWMTGWLIGVAYYRTGWWRGTLWSLLALAPGSFAIGLLRDAAGTELDGASAVRIAVAAGVTVLMWLVAEQVTADTELRGSTTWMRTG